MIVHVALDGIMEGALGLGLDVIDTAARLLHAGRSALPVPRRALAQRVVSHDGRAARSVQGRPIAVDGALSLRSLRAGDVLVLPGVLAERPAAAELLLMRSDVQRVVALLPRAARKGVVIAASCSATFFVAAAGLLDGTSATTTWWLTQAFTRRFGAVHLRSDAMVVASGAVLTAGSAFAHVDLMLAVVSRVASPSLAELVARYLVLDARASQSQYMVMHHVRSFDPVLQQIESFVGTNLDRQVSLAELAHACRTSARTLARRVHAAAGTTPQKFVQRLRIIHAAHLLESTRTSVEGVAARVGYADPAAFRRAFRRHAGTTPRLKRPAAA